MKRKQVIKINDLVLKKINKIINGLKIKNENIEIEYFDGFYLHEAEESFYSFNDLTKLSYDGEVYINYYLVDNKNKSIFISCKKTFF